MHFIRTYKHTHTHIDNEFVRETKCRHEPNYWTNKCNLMEHNSFLREKWK